MTHLSDFLGSLLTMASLFLGVRLQTQARDCPPRYGGVSRDHNTICFHIVNTEMNWWDAREYCKKMNGDLVWFRSLNEQNTFNLFLELNRGTIARLNNQGIKVWLGIYRKNCEEMLWTGPDGRNGYRVPGFDDNKHKNNMFFISDGEQYRYIPAKSGHKKHKAVCRHNSPPHRG